MIFEKRRLRIFDNILRYQLLQSAFTLVEMLMALLIVSVILSASLPVISQRQKAMASSYNQNRSFPIGGVILWTDMNKLPDNTWMECNGTAIPNGIEYEQARRVFGTNLPDLRNNSMEYINNLNTYLSNDIKNYLQNAIKQIPKNVIAIWGTNDAIPDGWSWDRGYDGYFIRGADVNRAVGTHQYDAGRNIYGGIEVTAVPSSASGAFYIGGVAGTMAGGVSGLNHVGFYLDASRIWGTLHTAAEFRPVNKAVKFIKYTNTPALPNIPDPPQSKIYYRYIAKVRY